MLDSKRCLSDLKGLVTRLEDDLRERCDEVPEAQARLQAQYDDARRGQRTAAPYLSWRDEQLTQISVAWVLACVFIRFLEDNDLLDEPKLSGVAARRQYAMDRRTHYFREHPSHTDRHYLQDLFQEMRHIPAMASLFHAQHNPLWTLGPSADGACALVEFWQAIDPETGTLIHDFTDPEWDTRFLGDLYQDLSESARKRFALLQTPDFVESFILDHTLTPAIHTFGYQQVRLIDPTCGSGHFLLGAFHRLFDLWVAHEPGTNVRGLAQRALDGVYGVDVNPYAVAIARFRLLLAAMRVCGETQLAKAPGFRIHLAAGDSLLFKLDFHGDSGLQMTLNPEEDVLAHCYECEDRETLTRILGQTYHAVVGNPPYIRCKDAALRQAYRERYDSCYREFSLGAPFTERFFHLAMSDSRDAGFVGLITSNSFMKREFGKRLITECMPRWNLTHVIDTSGAYIPGHGTPTVIIFGRNRQPIGNSVRAALGIRGEPKTPDVPSEGKVWRSIITLLNQPGEQNDFMSVEDKPADTFFKHPWSLGGGGAADLRESLDSRGCATLGRLVDSIGFMCITKQDEVFCVPTSLVMRKGMEVPYVRDFGVGEEVRDWSVSKGFQVIFPYESDIQTAGQASIPNILRSMWAQRSVLYARKVFGGGDFRSEKRPWYEYGQIPADRFRTPLSIAFAFVASHNHFVLDRGGKVFNRSAPVIKLPAEASEDDHLALLGLLNSSTACFWMKQVFHNKGNTVDTKGARQTTLEFENFFEFAGTGMKTFPIPKTKPLSLSKRIDDKARALLEATQTALDRLAIDDENERARRPTGIEAIRGELIALQEELDWQVYRLYGIVDEDLCHAGDDLPNLELGQRAFEIVMARTMTPGDPDSVWFSRHRSTPITEIPTHWPQAYQDLVARRIDLIQSHPQIGLIETPNHKRRWQIEPWEKQVERALHTWLLDRMEGYACWKENHLVNCRQLTHLAQQDDAFMQAGALYRHREDFDVQALVTELVLAEAVPMLPVLTYKASGLRKRQQWEQTWDLQRQEDAIDARITLPETDPGHLSTQAADRLKAQQIGEIPVPPKYKTSDFLKPNFWRLRGKLDVPKERFIVYPFCESDTDPSPVVGWAGWDALQQAQALAEYTLFVKQNQGWPPARRIPLLAAMHQLIPWLKQWHNDYDPTYATRMGDYFEAFLDGELREAALTTQSLNDWNPKKK